MAVKQRLMGLFGALSILGAGASAIDAHPVTVDGDPGDWQAAPGVGPNQGILVQGEYIWEDAGGDECTDFASPDPGVDLLEFHVTADAQGLYFMARLADLVVESGNGATQLQIAIDQDQVVGVGQTWLGGFADTQVAPEAAWERLVITTFGSGAPEPQVLNEMFVNIAVGGSVAAQASAANDCIEIHVGWDLLGIVEPASPLRFSLALVRTDFMDQAWDVAGTSDVLDAATNYADPGLAGHTRDEVADGVLRAHWDLWFHLGDGLEPSPPLLISEVLYDAFGAEPAEEWVEIVNLTGLAFPLAGIRIGDEETPDAAEGMLEFPPGGAIPAGDVIVLANNAQTFYNEWTQAADYEMVDGDPGVPGLTPVTAWSTGGVNLSNSGDQLLLIDSKWTILDVVTWESATYPGIIAALGAIGGQSIARLGTVDTDDCSQDFEVLTLPNPGEGGGVSDVARGVPTAPVILHQNRPNPFNPGTTIAFELERPSSVELVIMDPAGRRVRTLLAGAFREAGGQAVRWDGRDGGGRTVAAGVYYYRLSAAGAVQTRSMVLVK